MIAASRRISAGLVCALFFLTVSNSSADILVTSAADSIAVDGNCTLREAVQAANTNSAIDACEAGSATLLDVIRIPAGVYTLTLAGAHEDANLTGDLDLLGYTHIRSDGNGAPTISGGGIDRVFHIHPGATVLFGSVTITGGQLDSAGPDYDGGAILSESAHVWVFDSTITDNRSNYGGGGVAVVDGEVEIWGSTVSGNRCNFGTASLGCGISMHGTSSVPASLEIHRSTITANRNQNGFGFAIDVVGDGAGATTALLENTTISGNLADSGSSGGLHVEDGPLGGSGKTTAVLNNVTITGNTDVGVYAEANVPADVRVDVYNSIVAANATYDCEGPVYSGGHNVVGDATPPFMLSSRVCDFRTELGDQVVADPGLEGLASNGGQTQTHALAPSSPARDAGSTEPLGSGVPACTSMDQRDSYRFRFGCDAGAYDEGVPLGDCPDEPLPDCRRADYASIFIKDKDADGPGYGDKIKWSWKVDDETVAADFADPTASTGYSLCVYNTYTPGAVLVASATIEPAPGCGAGPCWSSSEGHYQYFDIESSRGGTRTVALAARDTPGSASIKWGAGGNGLLVTDLDFFYYLEVQLARSDRATCWRSGFSPFTGAGKHTPEIYKSRYRPVH